MRAFGWLLVGQIMQWGSGKEKKPTTERRATLGAWERGSVKHSGYIKFSGLARRAA